MSDSPPGPSVTSRALALLATFDEGHRAQTLTEMARRAQVPVPTAHRLVAELSDWGALRRDAGGRYSIGRRLWEIGLLAPVQTGLREIAEPFLHDIYGTTLATVHLAVRQHTQVLYIDRLAGHASVPILSKVGSRLPLYATAVGKVLLAHAPEEVQYQVLTSPMRRHTAYTVVEPGRLKRQLSRCRVEGYATTTEEMSLGACSVAVPIRAPAPDGTGQESVVAALGIVVSNLRRTRGRLVSALQVAANGIGRGLRTRPAAWTSSGFTH